MKYETSYKMQKLNIFGHYPVNYDKIVKGAMDFLDPEWSDIDFDYEDNIIVWKPQDKGKSGHMDIRYKNPVQQRRA